MAGLLMINTSAEFHNEYHRMVKVLDMQPL